LGYSWGVVGHLMGVKNSDDLRKAHDSLQPAVIETYQTLGQSVPLFNALSEMKDKKQSWKSLDEAQQRIINSNILQMKSSGVDLDPIKKEKFNKLQLENAELSTKFSNNVLDSTKKFKLLLTNPSEVEGLPDSAKGLAAQTAVAQGHKDATAEKGPWVVTLDSPSYLPCMQHLRSREIREKLYRAFVTRASEGEHDNAPIISKILQNKVEMAKLLGYTCHAEKSLASKMAHDVDAVMNLIHMLREKSLPAAQKDLQQLQEYAKSQGFTDTLKLWDIPFWSERLREAKYEYKDEELRPYFALPNVLTGLFSLANRLFGITIVEATKEVQIWHDDVQFFKVFDEKTGEHIASFYLDPFSRPAEKRGGAWMDVCIGRSKVLGRKPVAYLTCNGSPPVGSKPSLMSFYEVETLFHEFGHGLQHMLTTVEHAEAAGSKCF
jgi:oligopeptidase A